MAENYNDYGDYSEELVYESKSRLGKFFSLRTLKRVFRVLFSLVVIFVYGILFFRLCTGNPAKQLSRLVTTQATLDAVDEGKTLTVYAQEPAEHIARDGYFGIYDVRYIVETGEIQLTVRYNNSSVKKLRDRLTEDAAEVRRLEIVNALAAEGKSPTREEIKTLLEASIEREPLVIPEISERPFVFILRDSFGRVYTSYHYLTDKKTVYQYERLVFSGVDLFGGAKTAPKNEYPTPSAERPADIYKGANAGESGEIAFLYLDMYYEGDVGFMEESFAVPLVVYRSVSDLKEYNYKKELGSSVTGGLQYKEVEETSN